MYSEPGARTRIAEANFVFVGDIATSGERGTTELPARSATLSPEMEGEARKATRYQKLTELNAQPLEVVVAAAAERASRDTASEDAEVLIWEMHAEAA